MFLILFFRKKPSTKISSLFELSEKKNCQFSIPRFCFNYFWLSHFRILSLRMMITIERHKKTFVLLIKLVCRVHYKVWTKNFRNSYLVLFARVSIQKLLQLTTTSYNYKLQLQLQIVFYWPSRIASQADAALVVEVGTNTGNTGRSHL